MEPYQRRVVDEKRELDAKISKLSDFLAVKPPSSVPADELRRMSVQLQVMLEYSEALGDRIGHFLNQAAEPVPEPDNRSLCHALDIANARIEWFKSRQPVVDSAIMFAAAVNKFMIANGQRLCTCDSCPQGVCCCGAPPA